MFENLDVAANIATVLGFGLTVLGYVLAFLSFALWKRIIKPLCDRWKYRKAKASSEYILAVGLQKNIKNMKAKIKSQGESTLPKLKGLPIKPYPLPNHCTPADLKKIMAELEVLRDEMADLGRFNVHLFYAGPVVLASVIGGFFCNKDTVYIYQHKGSGDLGSYEYWGLIDIPRS